MLGAREAELHTLGAVLLEHGRLSGAQVSVILAGGKKEIAG